MHFILPLAGERKGGAAPAARCVAPEPRPDANGRQPRCVLAFPLSVTTAVATPDGALLLVAAVNAGVTAWRMPAGELAFAFAAPPPRVVPADEPPHGDAASAMAVDRAGREAIVGLGNVLLRYEVATGRLIGQLPAPGNLVRGVAYTPDGGRVLVSVFSDPAAHLIESLGGHRAGIYGLGWAGTVLASGDTQGRVALWDCGDRVRAP